MFKICHIVSQFYKKLAPCNAECPEYILMNFKHREPLHLLKLKIVRNMILPFRCSSNFSLFSAHADIRNEYCSVLRFGRAFRVELYQMTKDSSGKTETLDISSNSQLEIKTATPINSILLPHIIEKVMVSSTDDIQ